MEQTTDMRMIIWVCRITRDDKIRKENIKESVGVASFVRNKRCDILR